MQDYITGHPWNRSITKPIEEVTIESTSSTDEQSTSRRLRRMGRGDGITLIAFDTIVVSVNSVRQHWAWELGTMVSRKTAQ